MADTNAAIAAVFTEIADRLEIRGDNPFRIRAYRNAARTVEALPRDVRELAAAGEDLTAIPGIGQELAEKIGVLLAGDSIPLLERLRAELPAGVMDLLKVQGLGPKRIHQLHAELSIASLAELEQAARAGRLRALRGFGVKLEDQVLASLAVVSETARRRLRAAVQPAAEALEQRLAQSGLSGRITLAGSYRRSRETIGDLDLLTTADHPEGVMDLFVNDSHVATVLARGPTRASVQWQDGLQVDLRVVAPDAYGAALHYFTGSKAHNIAIRRLGQARGLKINEYGVFRDEHPIGPATEEADVFAAVGLPWIAPELREDNGEIEAAQAGQLPALITAETLNGDLHVHTTDSDGAAGLEAMAAAAAAKGYAYIAITDHSRALTVVNGLDETRLLRQIEAIDRFNAANRSPVTLLKGIETEILENGDLDLSDTVLRRLDLVIGSVHSHFHLPAPQQTERIMRAMDHPAFSILAHPTGRLLLERAPMELDMGRIIRHARQRGCAIELNAHPRRLDLNAAHCRMARDEQVPVCINSDAHQPGDLDNLRFGIGQARRGWLTAGNVLNTLPLKRLRQQLAAMRR